MPRYGVSPRQSEAPDTRGRAGLIGDGDDMVIRSQHVLGEPTVRPEPDELSTATELFLTLMTLPAGAVTPVRIDHDQVAFGEACRCGHLRTDTRRCSRRPRVPG